MTFEHLNPLKSLVVQRFNIPAWSHIPNTSVQNRPLVIYRSAFPQNISASQIETHLTSVGVVQPQWRYTMYATSHFHSTTHEVLCISSGKAKLRFGHEANPGSVLETVEKGDVIVVPAGVAHRLEEDSSASFEMIGSYPVGAKQWDMCYGKAGESAKVAKIKDLPWFARDPIYGDEGPVLAV